MQKADDVDDSVVGPGLTNTTTTLSLENKTKSTKKFDPFRSLRFASLGLVVVTPSVFYWYRLLNYAVPGTLAVNVAQRVALDQFVFTPVFLSVFLSTVALVENKRWSVQNDLPSTLVTNWAVWIPFQAVNFSVVPKKLQVLAQNGLAVL